jgi:hypothetical protein
VNNHEVANLIVQELANEGETWQPCAREIVARILTVNHFVQVPQGPLREDGYGLMGDLPVELPFVPDAFLDDLTMIDRGDIGATVVLPRDKDEEARLQKELKEFLEKYDHPSHLHQQSHST